MYAHEWQQQIGEGNLVPYLGSVLQRWLTFAVTTSQLLVMLSPPTGCSCVVVPVDCEIFRSSTPLPHQAVCSRRCLLNSRASCLFSRTVAAGSLG